MRAVPVTASMNAGKEALKPPTSLELGEEKRWVNIECAYRGTEGRGDLYTMGAILKLAGATRKISLQVTCHPTG